MTDLQRGRMSASKLRILMAIVASNGPITLREILRKTGVTSTNGLMVPLKQLKEEGLIGFDHHKARTIHATCKVRAV